MANELIIKNGFFSQGDSDVTGSLQVSGSIGVTGSGSAILSVYGSQGNLLIVTDSFSGSLFTVTDISGYPLLDVSSGSVDIVNPVIVTGSLAVNNGASDILDTSLFVLTDGTPSIDWTNRTLNDGANTSVDWYFKYLLDSRAITSIDWTSRYLHANDGTTTHIDWSNPSYMVLPSISESSITNVLGIDGSGNLYYTASSAIGGGGSAFPYTGSAIITGSLTVTGSITLGQNFYGKIYDNDSQIVFEANRPFISGGNTATIKSNNIDITGSTINVIGQLTHLALTSSFKPFSDPSYVLYRNEAGAINSIQPPGNGKYPFPSLVARNTAGSTVTGTVAQTLSISSSLTLGAISTGSIYRVKALVTKTGTAGSTFITLYNADSNGENQTNLLGHYTMSAGQLYAQFERTLVVSSSGQTIIFPTALSTITDVTSSTTTPTISSINYRPFGGGINQFMSMYLQNSNTGDSSVVRYITVETL